jgi:hypothetical protein
MPDMSLFDDLRMYARFAWGFPGFLRQRITLDEARAIVQRRLVERETAFLRLIERGVYGYPRSPYLPLLKLAQCELGDIQAMVRQQGLEPTLRALRTAGVFVTFEEYKGRAPLVRDGQLISVEARDFDNPWLSGVYRAETGGTTGAGTRVTIDLDHQVARAPHIMLAYAAHGVLAAPTAIWRGVLPDNTGVSHLLRSALVGQTTSRWFTPLTSRESRSDLKNRLATQYIVGVGRLCGAAFPWPEPVPLDQAIVVARWAAAAVQAHGTCMVRTGISLAVRVCVAAQTAGLDLTGTTFMGGTEPPTPAKVQTINAVGARLIPLYTTVDMGQVGLGCAHPVDVNDLHFVKDHLAVVQAPRLVPGTDIEVDAFLYTTLLPSAPKLMLNVESDDYGIIEQRRCGCYLEEIGYTDHLRHIRSFRKLTGEGVTLIGSEMLHILEDVLPQRFGGTALDYQLLEEEDEHGFTRLNLIVSPRVAIEDEAAVVATVLEALQQGSGSASLASALWRQAQTLRIRRTEPVWTQRGKLNPLHLAARDEAQQ